MVTGTVSHPDTQPCQVRHCIYLFIVVADIIYNGGYTETWLGLKKIKICVFSRDCLCCRDLTSKLVDYQVVGHVGAGRCPGFFSVVEINDPDKRQCRGEETYCSLQFQRDGVRPGNWKGRHAGKNQKHLLTESERAGRELGYKVLKPTLSDV